MSNDERTLWCGNIHGNVSDEILYELFLQAGPLERVSRPRDHQLQKPKPFAFVTYEHEETVPYALELFQGTELYGQALRLQARGSQAKAKVAASSNGSVHKRLGDRIGARDESSRSFGQQDHRAERFGGHSGADRPRDRGGERYSDRGEDRRSDRSGSKYSDRSGDRYSGRGGDMYNDRGEDRYSDRGGDRYSERGGERYSDRGADRHSDRGADRYGGERPGRRSGRRDWHDDREDRYYDDSSHRDAQYGDPSAVWVEPAGRSERRRPRREDDDGWRRRRQDEPPAQRRGRW